MALDLFDNAEQVSRLHEHLDCRIEAWKTGYRLLGGKIFCGKGCSNCCTLTVNCTFPEAAALAHSLSERERNRLTDHIAGLRSVVAQPIDLKTFLHRYRKELGPCPFLTADGSCGAYHLRPCSCRSLIATQESRWCAQDFSSLSSIEKQQFMNGLDRSVVAFPMHYAEATQQMAQETERELSGSMRELVGFSLYGNLAVLAHMELNYALSGRLFEGSEPVTAILAREGLLHPFLAILTEETHID